MLDNRSHLAGARHTKLVRKTMRLPTRGEPGKRLLVVMTGPSDALVVRLP